MFFFLFSKKNFISYNIWIWYLYTAPRLMLYWSSSAPSMNSYMLKVRATFCIVNIIPRMWIRWKHYYLASLHLLHRIIDFHSLGTLDLCTCTWLKWILFRNVFLWNIIIVNDPLFNESFVNIRQSHFWIIFRKLTFTFLGRFCISCLIEIDED